MTNLFKKLRNLMIKIIDWFYKPFKNFIPPETFRYAVTGGANTLLDVFLYFVFYNFVLNKQIVDLGFVVVSPHIAAFIIVFPITFCSGFILAKYITFTQSELHGRKQLFRYGLTVLGSILLNYILLKFFVEQMKLWATVAKFITTIIVVIYSYILQRYFTFQTAKKFVSSNENRK